MVDDTPFWTILCICYFVGGLTIGYLFSQWRNGKKGKRTGTGRWDYVDKHLGDGGFNE